MVPEVSIELNVMEVTNIRIACSSVSSYRLGGMKTSQPARVILAELSVSGICIV